MKIVYSKHARKKFVDLKNLGIIVKKNVIKDIINDPLHTDLLTDPLIG